MARSLLRALLVAVGLMASGLSAQAQKGFVQGDLASQAIRLEQILKTEGGGMIGGKTAQQLQEMVARVRSEVPIRRLFLCHSPAMIAMRGTAGEITRADNILRELDR